MLGPDSSPHRSSRHRSCRSPAAIQIEPSKLAGLLASPRRAADPGGFLRLGFVTDLLSKPIRIGYLNGIAPVVLVGQLPKLLGFSVDADSLLGEISGTVQGVLDGEVNTTALVVGLASLAAIIVPKLLHSTVPGVLLSVVGAIVVTAWLGLEDQLPVVGASRASGRRRSRIRWSDVVALIGPAAGIALIAFADTGVLSRTFAAPGESVQGDDEMRGASGLANVATGPSGFPISASSSRTPVAGSGRAPRASSSAWSAQG